MTFRIRYQRLDAHTHVHCRLFVAAAPDRTFALCGQFCLKPAELDALAEQCPRIRFVEDPPAESDPE